MKIEEVLFAAGAPIQSSRAMQIVLKNGSRIVAYPGKGATTRGLSGVKLLISDEAAYIDEEIHYALRPMLAASRGSHVMLSSPNGYGNFYEQVWHKGGDAWKRVKVTAFESVRIDKDWLEEERRTVPAIAFAQEYMCEFVVAAGSLFTADQVDRTVDENLAPLDLVGLAELAVN